MKFQPIPAAFATIPGILLCLFVIERIMRRRTTPARNWLLLLCGAATWWLAFSGVELAAVDPAAKILWSKIDYIGIVLTPPAWLLFAAVYTRQSERAWLRWPYYLVEPVIMLILVWTNERHGWFWPSTTPVVEDGFVLLRYAHGPAFWVHIAYAYLTLGLGAFLLLRSAQKFTRWYRGQALLVLGSAVAPWIANVAYLYQSSKGATVDPTPLGFVLSGLFLLGALSRYRLIDTAPVNPSAILDGMGSGIIVLDPEGRVVDLNAKAQEILGVRIEEAVRQDLATLAPEWATPQHQPLLQWIAAPDAGEPPQHHILTLHRKGERYYYEAHLSRFETRLGHTIGTLIALHDITAIQRAQEHLRASEAKNHALLEAIPDQIFLIDDQGVIQEFKASWDDGFAIDPHGLLGASIWDLFPEPIAERFQAALRQALHAGDTQTLSYQLESPSGLRYFEARFVAYSDEAVVVTVRNVTEREEAALALQRQRA
ncbi:MAG: PAS domain S-box protein, partial [Caldilineae bacterium]